MTFGGPGLGRAWDVLRLRHDRDVDEYTNEMQSRGSGRRPWSEVWAVSFLFGTVLVVGFIVRLLL